MKLYLSDDEAPPARATAGSSKIWAVCRPCRGARRSRLRGREPARKIGRWRRSSACWRPTRRGPCPLAQRRTGSSHGPRRRPTWRSHPHPARSAPTPTAKVEPTPAAPAPAASNDEEDSERRGGKNREKSQQRQRQQQLERQGSHRLQRLGESRRPTDGSWRSRQRTRRLPERARATCHRLRSSTPDSASPCSPKARPAMPFLTSIGPPIAATPKPASGLADAYRKLGQKSSAIEAYQAYLERLPSGSSRQTTRAPRSNPSRAALAARRASRANPLAATTSTSSAGELEAPAAEAPSGASTP